MFYFTCNHGLTDTRSDDTICSDSQAAIRAIRKPKPKTIFKLVRVCISALDMLATSHPVCVTWVPGHTGKQGNERADQLARQASMLTFICSEPSLPISHTVIKRQYGIGPVNSIINAGKKRKHAGRQKK